MKTNTIRTRTQKAIAGAALAVAISAPDLTRAADQLAWDKTFPQSDKVIHQKVSFNNRLGINLVADLYLPKNLDRSKKHPTIVVGGPYGAVKEQSSGLYAQTMAERGFVTLAAPPGRGNTAEGKGDNNNRATTMKIKIKIGSRTFTATLFDNPTATRLKAMLPLTLDMTELNGNEKYFHFSTSLPTDASNPGTIKSGDLMLWGDNSLVLFYKTFPTSYSYTRLGRIEDPSEVSSAVGSGSVKVTFDLE